jgi:DNA-binding transcriptional MerR regulator
MQINSTTSFPMGIGQLATLTQCSPETIRYYENEGLLTEASRTEGGHRRYTLDQYRMLVLIRRARKLGFTQSDVRHLVQMANPEKTLCKDVYQLAQTQLTDVREKIADLSQLEKTLLELISDCDAQGSPTDCPMIESLLDEAC